MATARSDEQRAGARSYAPRAGTSLALAIAAAALAAIGCPAPRRSAPAAVAGSPAAPARAEASAWTIALGPAATTRDLMAAIRNHDRAQIANKECYVAFRQRADGLPTLTLTAGQATAFGAFTCDRRQLDGVLEGRAIYLTAWWIDFAASFTAVEAANLHFGPRGKGYIGRNEAGFGLGEPAADTIERYSQGADEIVVLAVPTEARAAANRTAAAERDAHPPTAAAMPQAGAPLSWDDVLPVLERKGAELRRCFGADEPEGAISLDITLGSDGAVSEIALLSTTLPDQKKDDCVIAIVRTLGFTPPRDGSLVVLSLPFIFSD
jgi:hypothetical protein